MARTFRNLWPLITCWDNLLRAYRKCRRRKRYRQPATEFDFAWEENLLQLQRDLVSGEYQHGPYHHFHISDPKPRVISAAPFRDRVVHHALVAVLEPIFERRFVFDSYACRLGKGTHRAIKRAQHYMRRYQWSLKTDIVKFFPNIDHEILLDTLHRRIVDPKAIELIGKVIQSGTDLPDQNVEPAFFPGDDLFSVLRPRGLPIGNLTSQFFANVYLDPLDHFIKEELRVPGYVRYADDILLLDHTKERLWGAVDEIRGKLCELRLTLHSSKTHVCPANMSITYLGFQVGPNELRLSQQGIARFRRRLRRQRHEYVMSRLDLRTVTRSLKSWRSHVHTTNSSSLRRVLMRNCVRFRRTAQSNVSSNC